LPHISVCSGTEASGEALAVYKEFYLGMGFPSAPNFILTQGHAPNVARGSWESVKNILMHGEIPRWIKELMFVAISVDRRCVYCAAAHIACCRMLDVNPEWTEAVAQGDPRAIADPKLRDMILFALHAARDPQNLTAGDYNHLRFYGLRQSEIMEIIGMAAFAVYANIIVDATAMDCDPMFDEVGRQAAVSPDGQLQQLDPEPANDQDEGAEADDGQHDAGKHGRPEAQARQQEREHGEHR
jgi:uncharacterized peroxidase-related enzyme